MGPVRPSENSRTISSFIGGCPMVSVMIQDIECTGLLDTGSQINLMQRSMFEEKFPQYEMGQDPVLTLRAANGLEIPYIGYAVFDFNVAGVQVPDRGVVIVKDEFSTNPLIIGMNVISQCWSALFQNEGHSSSLFQSTRERQAWQQVTAVCQRVADRIHEDGSLGNVWLANRRGVRVPPRSEIIVWERARMGLRQRDYCGLVEPVSEQPVAAARTIAMVRDGKMPVRLCNIHPYSVFVGKYQKLGRLYEVNSPDIYGCRDLGLTLDTEGIVEVSLTEASPIVEDAFFPGICQFSQRSDLTTQQCQDLDALLRKWSKVFSEGEEDVGYTEVVQHRIHTGNVPPIRERFRPLPPMMYQEMKALLADMLNKGVISESASPWAAPVVMVKKKDGSWRFCVDYRKLNAITHKDAFPLPRIEETLTTLKRAEWFSTLDLASGYWQVGVDPSPPLWGYTNFSVCLLVCAMDLTHFSG